MQAIVTKYISPTNFRGTRIKATAAAGSLTVAYDYALSIDENHRHAASELQVKKFGWLGNGYGTLFGGTMANGDYRWVMVKA